MTKLEYPESPYKDIEFLDSLEGRTLRILSEYLGPMTRLDKAKINSTVLFLGSARADPSHGDSGLHEVLLGGRGAGLPPDQVGHPAQSPRARTSSSARAPAPGSWKRPTAAPMRAGGKTIGMNISAPPGAGSQSLHLARPLLRLPLFLHEEVLARLQGQGRHGLPRRLRDAGRVLRDRHPPPDEQDLQKGADPHPLRRGLLEEDRRFRHVRQGRGHHAPTTATCSEFCSTPRQAFALSEEEARGLPAIPDRADDDPERSSSRPDAPSRLRSPAPGSNYLSRGRVANGVGVLVRAGLPREARPRTGRSTTCTT